MKPEALQSWQPQASLEQLSDFINKNSTLLILLEEAWDKFIATQPASPIAESVKPVNQPSDINWETLEHFPITQDEMIEFLNHFEKERHHNDRPFGDNVVIQEQNWQIDGLDND